jgi:hypothetical protein
MAFDEALAERIRRGLPAARTSRRRRCSAASASCSTARLGPDEGEAALREPHVRVFDITGRPMRNWVVVEPEGVEDDEQLVGWIERAVKFVRTLPKK